ncbi:MAG: hypothetical protein QS748_06355 [Candidatus Endonucleobacter bathymodioli]|uniref:Uncharacterized protein n=1 Tax=Candidatus Endonucleibacter bathymodioli TaxID=539814 RepID=A0AA90SD38_9GAMM|nr:hypothetical protein [Candidatus Endonucleobacter bathymodioli]
MMLSHVILIRFIFITSTAFLFSYNAYGVHHKNIGLTLNSSKIDCNTSHKVFSPVTSNIETETCVYNTKNAELIFTYSKEHHYKHYLEQLHSLTLKAIKHPANCKYTHNATNVISFFTAAHKCKDDASIMMLADQLVKGEVEIENDIWCARDIWSISTAIHKCSGSNIEYLRKMIARKIVNPHNDMSSWRKYNITNILKSLVSGNSNKEHEAFQHIMDHIVTKNCNMDQWGGLNLSRLFKYMVQANTEGTKMAMLKVLGVISKSGLSYCNIKSIETIFQSLVILHNTRFLGIENEKSYKITLQLIINHLAHCTGRLKGYNDHELTTIIKGLCQIGKLEWLENVDKAKHTVSNFIIEEGINTKPTPNNY